MGALAALQAQSGHLARHLNARTILVLGTLLSTAGFALAGHVGLCASLALAFAGAAHSIRLLPPLYCVLTAKERVARSAHTTSPATWARRRSRRLFLCCSP